MFQAPETLQLTKKNATNAQDPKNPSLVSPDPKNPYKRSHPETQAQSKPASKPATKTPVKSALKKGPVKVYAAEVLIGGLLEVMEADTVMADMVLTVEIMVPVAVTEEDPHLHHHLLHQVAVDSTAAVAMAEEDPHHHHLHHQWRRDIHHQDHGHQDTAAEEDLLYLHLPHQVREDRVDTHHQGHGHQDMAVEVDLHHHHLHRQALQEAHVIVDCATSYKAKFTMKDYLEYKDVGEFAAWMDTQVML